MHSLPEHALPHLVHLLAHRPHEERESDYKFEAAVCNFLLVHLTHTSETFPFLDQLIRFMKSTVDAETPTSDVCAPCVAPTLLTLPRFTASCVTFS